MIKRIFALVIISSLVSAGLIFLGTALLGKFSPALASSLSALVAGTDVQAASVSNPAEEKVPPKIEVPGEAKKPDVFAAVKATPTISINPTQPLKVSNTSSSGAAPITGVTIAQLLKDPGQFSDKTLTITGIATSLGHEKFLLNDGTGQILVEVDDDPGKYVVLNGQSITITGKLDDFSSQGGVELEACTVTDPNGTFVLDDCDDDSDDDDVDDSDDDVNDDPDDDDVDDSDDDVDDDSDDDDSMNDSDDDSDDDSSDDDGEDD